MRRADYRKVIRRLAGGMWQVDFELTTPGLVRLNLQKLAKEARRDIRAKLPLPAATVHKIELSEPQRIGDDARGVRFVTTTPPLGRHHFSLQHAAETCFVYEDLGWCHNPRHYVCTALWYQQSEPDSQPEDFRHFFAPGAVACQWCDRTESHIRKDLQA